MIQQEVSTMKLDSRWWLQVTADDNCTLHVVLSEGGRVHGLITIQDSDLIQLWMVYSTDAEDHMLDI